MTKTPASQRLPAAEMFEAPEQALAIRQQQELDQRLAHYFQCAPGLFFTLRQEADGRMAMPFIGGRLDLLPGLTAAALAEDIGPFLALCHPNDVSLLLSELQRSAREMNACRAEFRLGDGTVDPLVIELSAVPQRTAVGSDSVAWHGFMHDITARTEYEAALLAKTLLQEQLSAVAQALPGFLYTTRVDANGISTFPFASDGIEALFGLRPEDLRNDGAALRARYHPDDLPQLFDGIKESCRTLRPFRHEIRIFHPEQGLRWVEMRSTPRRLPDGTVEAHGLMIDITERKDAAAALSTQYEQIVQLNDRLEDSARSQEEYAVELEAAHEQLKTTEAWYRGILHSAPDGMLVVNEGGGIMLVNAELCRMFGYAEHELLGQSIEMLVPTNVRDGHPKKRADFIAKTLHTKAVHIAPGLWACRKDGSQFAVDVTVAGLPDSDFSEGTICAAIRDVSERRETEERLAEARSRLLSVFQTIPDLIWMKDADGVYLACNHHFERFFGASRAEIVGKTDYDFVDAELADFFRRKDREAIDAGRICINEEWITYAENGQEGLLETRKVPVYGADGRVSGVLGVARDITERKRIEEALAVREHEFRTLIENTPDAVARFGRDLGRLYVNPAAVALLGREASTLIGKKPSEIPGGIHGGYLEARLSEVFASGTRLEFEQTWPGEDGRVLHRLVNMTPELDEHGEVFSVLAVGRDITELNAFRQKIHQMAFYDTLTALPNRALFNDRLRQMITDASWHGQLAGVMMIDMDRFKAVNDTMGHAVGDDLLRETAARLTGSVRAYDTVARLGGDEFAILLPEIRAADDLGRIANKILAKFDERFLLAGKEVFMSCSVGIALYPNDSTDAEDLLKFADSAMYFAKRSGRNHFRFYSKDLTASAQAHLTLESELRRAIERNELELHYQPKIALHDGQVIGSEALLRWQHPEHGLVPPMRFIQIAEDTGLIIDIGKWVLREACRTAAAWNAAGAAEHKVAINLSPRQFQSEDLLATVVGILEETACRPEWVELEITESLLLEEDDRLLEILETFRVMGISIAIDDFGTGYSALSYLTRFPINTLKIDRSFINKVTTDNYHAELVRAILSIARCLGQQVVAEGVETIEQAAFLARSECHVAQGFLYSKALPKAEFALLPRYFPRPLPAAPVGR